jgi:hypothetical protein
MLFGEADDTVEHPAERGARGDLLEQPALTDREQLGPLALGLIGQAVVPVGSPRSSR